MAGQGRVDWSNVRADYERLGTHKAVAEEYGVAVGVVSARLAPGARTSIYLAPALAARRDWVRKYTGLRDGEIFERGLLVIEAELAAAFAWDPARWCPHPARYRNGACTRCYARPPGVPGTDDAGTAGDGLTGEG